MRCRTDLTFIPSNSKKNNMSEAEAFYWMLGAQNNDFLKSVCPLNFGLRLFGFRPRQFGRYDAVPV